MKGMSTAHSYYTRVLPEKEGRTLIFWIKMSLNHYDICSQDFYVVSAQIMIKFPQNGRSVPEWLFHIFSYVSQLPFSNYTAN